MLKRSIPIFKMLGKTIKHGGAKQGPCSRTLESLGISKNQSSEWQRIAEIDDEDFEKWIEATKRIGEKITMAALMGSLISRGGGSNPPEKSRGQNWGIFMQRLALRIQHIQKSLERVLSIEDQLVPVWPKELDALKKAVTEFGQVLRKCSK